jgi:hypothetical protein
MKRQQMDQVPYLLDVRPEKIMHAFKSYSRRNLKRLGVEEPDRKRWARHGSTFWLWKDEDLEKAICYAVSGQGEAMEVHRAELADLTRHLFLGGATLINAPPPRLYVSRAQ